jgi:hypothetical protein
MACYVDDVRLPFRNMVMCHMWADTLPELLAMARKIGVQEKWLQKPPKASWVHFDISVGKKELALKYGAILTDKYGPVEHVAKLEWNGEKLAQIQKIREKEKSNDRDNRRNGPHSDT